ncbi:DNA-processing protein DprA [Mucilaginibacter sp. FT3.2]|uniref:DNA-processing protein DprA n=1 Tax=Mucilaginibacter sp. FT3.2 TaxID=2723090 RepID=UPI00160E2E38|nr:DNA-processing protein DprA [Mucilaginibacter sp. FT3.2]MBB6229598.1 DNA processing protein [Mucilaginibacter sp. FT3.2]
MIYNVALSFVKNLGPVAAKSLMAYLGGAEEIFKASPAKMATIPGIGQKRAGQWDFEQALKLAEKEILFAEKNGIDIIYYTDARYPKRLKNCGDSPILLYAKGKMELNMPKVISIVGTRNATDYGKQLCHQLVEELQQYNVLIASGLALGIDVAAHKACLKMNVPTVGVLGHGLDRLYPSLNRATADKMLENGGLLTEYPSGTTPDRENFPQRNRIVAGMADATVVIEASLKGGALITAEIANSYNRDVFAFPGRLDDVYSEGCNFLIRNNKASLLTCVADLAFSLGWEKADNAKPVEQFSLPLDLTNDERLIFDILQQNKTPLAIDELTIKANMPMSSLAMNLLNMEMHGYIRSLPGKTYKVG